MHPARARWAGLLSFALALFASPLATAAIETTTPAASLKLRTDQTPAFDALASFSVVFYYRPSALPTGENATMITVPGSLSIRLTPEGTLLASLFGVPADPPPSSQGPRPELPEGMQALAATGLIQIDLESPEPLELDEFALIALSYDRPTGRADLWVSQGGGPIINDTETLAGFRVNAPTSGLTFGSLRTTFPPTRAPEGLYDIFAVRRHAVNEIDIATLRENRRAFDLFDLENRVHGGRFNSTAGIELLLNHAMLAEPVAFDGQPTNGESSIVGYPVRATSFSRVTPVVDNFGLTYAGPISSAAGYRYRSHAEPEFDGYFLPTVLSGFDLPQRTSCVAPLSNMLANATPQGLIKVIISANSRSVRRKEQLLGQNDTTVGEPSTGSYISGFWAHYRDQTAGMLIAAIEPNSDTAYFGFDATEDKPRSTGDVKSIHGDSQPHHEFSRFWTSMTDPNTFGPGTGTYITPDAAIELKAKPEGLIVPDAPLIVQIHTLAFPGASTLTYSAVQEDRQSNGNRVNLRKEGVSLFDQSLDTTNLEHTVTESDEIAADQSFVRLLGDLTGAVLQGDACVNNDSDTAGITTVTRVTLEGAFTKIELSTPLAREIEAGTTLRFGPWEHVTLSYEWPALPETETRNWRGLCAESHDDGLGNVVFAFSCYRPGVDGFAFGAAGWSGNGYNPQLSESVTGSLRSLVREIDPDIWFQIPAQQQTTPNFMDFYAVQVGLELREDAEIVWAGECSHGSIDGLFERDFADWHHYILTNGPARGYPSLSLLEDPVIGDYKTQLIDGRRIDGAHITQRGNALLVERWMGQLQDAARVPGDCDGNGNIDFNDLICGLFQFGQSHGPADCDRSGTVGFDDLICTLFGFTAGN